MLQSSCYWLSGRHQVHVPRGALLSSFVRPRHTRRPLEVLNYGGFLRLSNCTLSGNIGDVGGGIESLNLNGSVGTLQVTNSTIHGNSARASGGAGGVVIFSGSLFSGNNLTVTENIGAKSVGGIAAGGIAVLANSIVANNRTGSIAGSASDSMRAFALRAYQPFARRVYQPAVLPQQAATRP